MCSHRRFEVPGDKEIVEKRLWKSWLEGQLYHSWMGITEWKDEIS